MDIRNKKINFLGDSITEGAGTSAKEHIYLNVLKEKYGLAEARNYGIGGARIARQQHPMENRYDHADYCSRVATMDPDADIVVVFGGTNDFGHGDAPFGTPDDRTPDTFWGACHFMMRELLEKFSDSVIVIMTPLHRACEYQEGRKPLIEYVRVIREVAEFYSLPVLDLYATSGLQPQVEINRKKYAPDGLHPNDAGAAIIADRLGAFLTAL